MTDTGLAAPHDEQRAASRTEVILDCTGVGHGGIERVLTEVVRHWPMPAALAVVGAPTGWNLPEGSETYARIASRQRGPRTAAILLALLDLFRITRSPSASVAVSLSPSLAPLVSRVPVVTVFHDLRFHYWRPGVSWPVRLYRRVTYGLALRRSAVVVSVSHRTKHDIEGLLPHMGGPIRVWRPGCSLSLPRRGSDCEPPFPWLPDGPYLVLPAHRGHKGLELAVAALPMCPVKTLVALGGSTAGDEWERVGSSPPGCRVVFAPYLTDAEYAALVQGSEALLMPSHFEGFGLPAAEALSLGIRTVISPDPGLLEATQGEGEQMSAWTAQSLAEAVHRALARDQRVVPGRTWSDSTRELALLIDEALTQRPPDR